MALELAVVCDSFGLGGTAKSAVLYASHHDRSRVRPRAIALGGPDVRDPELEAAGIEVEHVRRDRRRLVELLRGADAVHVHRGGLADPLVPAACREAGVSALVETNVFGFLDPSPDAKQFSTHLLISAMCAMRHRQQVDLAPEQFHRRHRVLHYPVDVDGLASVAPPAADARAALGLDADRPTVVRVGRDDDRKWGDILVAMVPKLLRLVPDVQLVFVGATSYRRRQLQRLGVLGRVVCLPPSGDRERLAAFYAAADVFVSASSIGESFGVAIAEAMALGVPVVTSSTPWTDNAQVEVVDCGRTGWVANHPRAFAEAVADLLGDEARRGSFAAAGAAKVREQWHPATLARRLEALFESVLSTGAPPEEWQPNWVQLAEFEAAYPRMAAAQFRPLSAREARQAGRAVLRERSLWALRDLRADPVHRAAALARMARDRIFSGTARRTAHE